MINKAKTTIFYIFSFLLPLAFFPPQPLSPASSGQSLIVIFATFLFFLVMLGFCGKRKITLFRTSIDFPLISLALLYLLSVLFVSPAKIDALASPMGAGTVVALVVLFIAIVQMQPRPSLYPFFAFSSLVAVIFMLGRSGYLPFAMYDNPLSVIAFFSPIFFFLIVTLAIAVLKGKTKKIFRKAAAYVLLAVPPVLLLLSSVFILLTKQKPAILPFAFGWSIMMETGKNIANFLLGVGPANFSYAFTSAKPVAFNNTPFWSAIFSVSSNFILTMAVEAGILAAIILIYIVAKSFFSFDLSKSLSQKAPLWTAFTLIVLFLFLFPPDLSALTLFVIFLAFVSPRKKREKSLSGKSVATVKFITLFLGLASMLLFYFQSKVYLADIFYRKAFMLAEENQLSGAIEHVEKAISFYPDKQDYYLLAGSLSLDMARSLSQNQQSTSSARQTSALLSQAVNYAKMSTQANPLNSQNWAHLSSVYQSFSFSNDEALQQAVETLERQIALDPNSPQPKVVLGNLLLSQGRLLDAYYLFSRAIELKPDWNNAHYNMALLLAQIKDYQGAVSQMRNVLLLTLPESSDYQKVEKELQELEKMLSQQATPSGEIEGETSQTP